MIRVPFFKKLAGYFYPVPVRRSGSPLNPILGIYSFRGRLQLGTADALYSDGDQYRPFRSVFPRLRKRGVRIDTALFLGTGLGSGLQILDRCGYRPAATLVDIDAEILRLAAEVLPEALLRDTELRAGDAAEFIANNRKQFDLVAVDIFFGREVPVFVTTAPFLSGCRRAMSERGAFVWNYILQQTPRDQEVLRLLREIFPGFQTVDLGLNQVYFLVLSE